VEELLSSKASVKQVKAGIRGIRNNTMHPFVDQLNAVEKSAFSRLVLKKTVAERSQYSFSNVLFVKSIFFDWS
jgi:hypothetical protein